VLQAWVVAGTAAWGKRVVAAREQSVALVQRALDLGINFIDTAEAYGTEAIVGQALEGLTRIRCSSRPRRR
jgi:aryl-alcohol dehydrogenase-like predicted oxidoreductase